MLFDLNKFLSEIDPLQTYECQPLTGGLVNLTVRARKTSSASDGLFLNHETVILKYAPPFVAALGEEAPFSQDRQLIEARSLALFTAPNGSLQLLGQGTSVVVPDLLYHSPEHHVLILEDLGPLITLYEYFSTSSTPGDDNPTQDPEICRSLGSSIGNFFAKVHSPESLTRIVAATANDLTNPLIKDLILQAAVLPIHGHLISHGIPNAHVLSRRVLADYQREISPEECCFVLGDFTPGAVLVSRTHKGGGPVGIIDWEFSGKGRGPNGDMAQILASLHLLLLAESTHFSSHSAISSLVQGICASYCESSRKRNEELQRIKEMVPSSHESILTGSTEANLYLIIFRSALILHGREMINQAIERDWACSDQEQSVTLVSKMVKRGAWYIERAGDDVDGMLDVANWEEMLKEDGQIILSLFGMEKYPLQ